MRAVILLNVACLGALPIWAQGQIGLTNIRPPLLDAPVYDSDCKTPVDGTNYLAQWYVGYTPDTLAPIASVEPFASGQYAGYTAAGAIDVPGTYISVIYVQLRAWEARGGKTFEEALASGAKCGISNIVPTPTYPPPAAPGYPYGLMSFCLKRYPQREGSWFIQQEFMNGKFLGRRLQGLVEGKFVLTIANPVPQQWMGIEVSLDLRSWKEIGNLMTNNRFGLITFVDETAEGDGPRFYRIRVPGTSVDQARALWESQNPRSYHFRLRYTVWEPKKVEYEALVSVKNGQKRVYQVTQGGRPTSDYDPNDFPTIEELFDRLELAVFRAARQVQVQYDPQRGFPVRCLIDDHQFGVSDEWGIYPDFVGKISLYTVSDLVIEEP